MKKWTSIFLILTLAAALLAGCGSKETPAGPGGVDGTPEEIIEKIYAQHKNIDLSLVTMEVDLSDADAVAYYTGLDNAEKIQAAAVSETLLGQPYSLVVVRMASQADAAEAARKMYDNMDTRKWICVMADTKTAAYSGDVAMFFMVNSDFAEDASVDSIFQAFRDACGGNAERIG